MNEHAGPACALSGLIVGAFAVLLYEKPEIPAAPKPPARSVADASPRRVEAPRVDSPPAASRDHPAIPVPTTPVIAHAEVNAIGGPAPNPLEAGPTGVREPRSGPSVGPPKATSPGEGRAESAKRHAFDPGRPRPPFTVVGPGETLVEVATRVYGSGDSARAIWKANRDQMERIDSELTPGTLLRTP